MKNKRYIIVVIIFIFIFTNIFACNFFFNYSEINAPLGITGTISVRVLKTHNNCTLTSMDDYKFEWGTIQVIDESNWNLVDRNLYEKQFQVVLSEIGNTYFKIHKTCSTEGYSEKVLPINILAGGEIANNSLNGLYPYNIDLNINFVYGSYEINEKSLTINDKELFLEDIPNVLYDFKNKTKIYYAEINEMNKILLIVSEQFYYRFDKNYRFSSIFSG